MMKKHFFAVMLILAAAVSYMSGCTKDGPDLPDDPITLVKPDTTIVRRFPDDTLAYEIQFICDRPLAWVKGMYDIDSLNQAGYVPTYPDTLFFVPLDTCNPRINYYTYSGVYRVPDTLFSYNTIRFRVSYEAGKSTFTVGQNYPAGIVTASKDFRIDVR